MRGFGILFTFFVINYFSKEALAFKCFGKELSRISLAPQFPQTKNQYGGTCYAHQAAGTVSAALRRQTLKSPSECAVSPEACALQLCDFEKSAKTQVLLDGRLAAPETLLDGSSKGAFQILQETRDLELIREAKETEKKFRSIQDHMKLGVEDKTRLRALNQKIKGLESEFDKNNSELKRLKELYDTKSKAAPSFDEMMAFYDENKKIYEDLNESRAARERLEKELIDKLCLSGICQNLLLALPSSGEKIKVEGSKVEALWIKEKTEINAQIQNCEKDKGLQKKRMEMILESLCQGIPLATDLAINEHYFAREKNVEARRIEPGGNHAVVLVGFFERKGKQGFIFRNSWGEESELFTSPLNICSITEAARLLVKSDDIPQDLESKRQRLESLLKKELVSLDEVKLVDETKTPETHQK